MRLSLARLENKELSSRRNGEVEHEVPGETEVLAGMTKAAASDIEARALSTMEAPMKTDINAVRINNPPR